MRAKPWYALALLVAAGPAFGQSFTLVESPKEGECTRLTIETTLTGQLKVTRDGKPAAIKINAKNEHSLVEKVLATEKGLPKKTARHYATAVSRATLDGEKAERNLS